MAVESSLAIRADVEDLGEFELFVVIHNETARDEDQEAALDGSGLDVLLVDAVVDFLEAEGLDFFCDFLDSLESLSSVGHDTVVIVEVDELGSVLHDSRVVLSEELLGDVFEFRHCKLPPKLYKSQTNPLLFILISSLNLLHSFSQFYILHF